MHILVLGGLIHLHKKLKDGGARLSFMGDADKINKLSDSEQTMYDRIISLPTTASVEERIHFAQSVNRIDRIDTIAAFHEMHQQAAAEIAQSLNLSYHSPELIARVRNKIKMRHRLAEAGLDSTACMSIASIQTVRDFVEQHGYPFIIKPIDGWASMNIIHIKDQAHLETKLDHIQELMQTTNLMIEEFHNGKEYSVEAFTIDSYHHVVAITEKFKDEETYVELGHCVPAPLPSSDAREIEEYVTASLSALGVSCGPSHTEIIVTDHGPRLIETHTRIGGDRISELVCGAMGINLDDLWVNQVLKTDDIVIKKKTKPSIMMVRFVSPRIRTGNLQEIRGLEEVEVMPHVKHIQIMNGVGTDLSGGVKHSFSRSLSYIVEGETHADVKADVQAALDKIKFLITC